MRNGKECGMRAWGAFAAAVLTIGGARAEEIVFENEDFRISIDERAVVRSLVVKATEEECIDASQRMPLCTATQDRPFNNELKLILPNKRTVFPATGAKLVGNGLIVSFSHNQYEAVIAVSNSPHYISFMLEDFRCDREKTYGRRRMDVPPVAAFRIMQLPVLNRKNFGDCLNASWDERAAVGVVGTSRYPDVDHEVRQGSRILYGEAVAGRRLRGCGVALIAAPGREAFLDAMDEVERDYGLPRGVKSRRSPEIGEFIYHLAYDSPLTNVDEIIAYARKGGFRLVTLAQEHVTHEIGSWGRYGDYDLRKDFYPNGLDDLKRILGKFHAAGMKVGLHTLHTHIGMKSRYVTPVADFRLNKTRRFTLMEDLPAGTNDISALAVCEPTADAVMYEPCRVLQFGGELLSYESYTTKPPYKFLGVRRGVWNTRPTAHARGEAGGILDVSEYGKPMSCYIDQNTDLQDEIAKKISRYYDCGFDYLYMDGSEGVNRPYGFHIADAQYRFWKSLATEPVFCEGAAKTHFGWHMLSGANAFDCFTPRLFKEKLREFPFKQAPLSWQDMTRVDFGWWGFWATGSPDWWDEKHGVQADLWEYGASVASAWNCSASVLMPTEELRRHPRTDDILETMRRWAEVRRNGAVKESWRESIKRDYLKEHHLVKLADGSYDLVRYEAVTLGIGENARFPIRSFVFEKDGFTWLVFWHVSGSCEFRISVPTEKISVFDEFAGRPVPVRRTDGGVVIPADNRRYLRTSLSRPALVEAMKSAAVVP